MSVLSIPFFSDPSWLATVTLEGISYVMQFDFNQRAYSWYMSIADADGNDIYNGVKLVTGFQLLKKCKDPRAPPGVLLVQSSTSDQSPPGQYDLIAGGRCMLAYITSDWVAILYANTAGLSGVRLTAQLAANLQGLLGQIAASNQISQISTYGQPPSG